MAYSKVIVPKMTATKIASVGDVATIQDKRIIGRVYLFHGAQPTAPFDFDLSIQMPKTEPFALGSALTEDVWAVSSKDTVIAIQKD